MPELPDVETYKRRLNATAVGKRVVEVNVSVPEILREISPQVLGRRLYGHRLEKTLRQGKYLSSDSDCDK